MLVPISSNNYMLCFFIDGTNEVYDKKIQNWQEKYGYKIVNLSDQLNKSNYALSPVEFISYIANAKLICTDSYHATIFSFIFERPFVVFERLENQQSMNSRFDTLLTNLNAQNRKASCIQEEELTSCNYSAAKQKVNEESKASMSYIKRHLTK